MLQRSSRHNYYHVSQENYKWVPAGLRLVVRKNLVTQFVDKLVKAQIDLQKKQKQKHSHESRTGAKVLPKNISNITFPEDATIKQQAQF